MDPLQALLAMNHGRMDCIIGENEIGIGLIMRDRDTGQVYTDHKDGRRYFEDPDMYRHLDEEEMLRVCVGEPRLMPFHESTDRRRIHRDDRRSKNATGRLRRS
jgi:ABC-type uncharacterized transport system ATPase subunit